MAQVIFECTTCWLYNRENMKKPLMDRGLARQEKFELFNEVFEHMMNNRDHQIEAKTDEYEDED